MRRPVRPTTLSAIVVLLATALAPIVLLADDLSHGSLVADGALAVIGLGFVLGLKHALDADHLVAVSALVSERADSKRASRVGMLWGLGHTRSLLIVGAVVLAVRTPIPDGLAGALELIVGVMIAGLGVRLLARLRRGFTLSLDEHTHGAIRHAHPHLRAGGAGDGESHPLPRARRPFLVGAVHGLAGSAALTLLVLAQISTPLLGVLYIALFGLGSVVGMAAMSTLFALPMSLLVRRFTRFDFGLRLAAGVFSVAFGLYLVVEIGFVDGLLLGR